MKPLHLAFCAFGSYPEHEEIDFTVLEPRGLFVVTGDTGAGKSTIFDAMCFALYGEMAGKPKDDIRSHHAQLTTDTYVRFRFESNGDEYLVERSPSYMRPRQRGQGLTEYKGKASLTRIDANGSSTGIANTSTAVTSECEKLIGLNADQFLKVLLLPQGDFQRFLLDKSEAREEILSKLFSGKLYEDIVEQLFLEFNRLKTQVGGSDTELLRNLKNARDDLVDLYLELNLDPLLLGDELDRDELGTFLEGVSAAISELEEEVQRAKTTADAARLAFTNADGEAKKFDGATALRSDISGFESVEPEVLQKEQEALRSQEARKVDAAERAKSSAEATHNVSKESLSSRLEEIESLLQCFDTELVTTTAQSIVESVAGLREIFSNEEGRLATVKAASADVDNLYSEIVSITAKKIEQENRKKNAQERVVEIGQLPGRDSIVGELDRIDAALPLLPQLGDLQSRIIELEGKAAIAGENFERILKRFLTTEAPRLAATLREGDPCPVCGSASHPHPAETVGSEVLEYSEVADAKSKLDTSSEELDALRVQKNEIDRNLVGLPSSSPGELEQRKELLLSQGRLIDEVQQLNRDLADVEIRVARLDGEENARKSELEPAEALLAEAKRGSQDIDLRMHKERSDALNNVIPLLKDLSGLYSNLATTEAELSTKSESLISVLAESGFGSVADARASIVSESIERDSIENAKRHRVDKQQATSDLAALEKLGVPLIRPDREGLERTSLEMEGSARDLEARKVRVGLRITSIMESLEGYDRESRDSSTLRGLFVRVEYAYTVCKGKGQVKVSLPRWVLGRELDRVAQAATGRLLKMTNGRYSLRRRELAMENRSERGLDLEVFDSHTGVARVPKSLSGGEQFQASLALALGLADVVSHGASGSGQRSHALFIDEGFGSLDPRALDDVIDTLQQLQATGRMVGAITHVPEMKERLHQGIVVSKRQDGRGSTLSVNP